MGQVYLHVKSFALFCGIYYDTRSLIVCIIFNSSYFIYHEEKHLNRTLLIITYFNNIASHGVGDFVCILQYVTRLRL